jgi:LytS/YehU family sensor histidine kinase
MFEDEYRTVKDYLDLESTRFEERLRTDFDIHPDSFQYLVPPLMLQTLVENGIKHGISNLKEGGTIKLKTFVEDELMHIQIRNTGQYVNGQAQMKSGFGIKNTIQRLKLIYGNNADFKIFNENSHTVLTIVTIPKIEKHESINN